MKPALFLATMATATICLLAQASSTSATGKLLTPEEVRNAMPATVFFQGQTAPVQMRNSAGVRTKAGKLVLAGLVDNSGYASDVAQKYQGYLITETNVRFGNTKPLPPGAYGVGFLADGDFLVMDLGGNNLLTVRYGSDSALHRPVPLQVTASDDGYRLYAGRKYVEFRPE